MPSTTARGELKARAYEANMALHRSGLVLATFGNVSSFDPSEAMFAIKPSGVPYETLRVEDLVLVDLEGKVVDSKLRPSTDTPTHLELYRAHPDVIGGVAHTHATYSCVWAQAQRSVPCLGTTHADYYDAAIPCTKPLPAKATRGEYEKEIGLEIVRTLRKHDPKLLTMILVSSHGPFTWGATAEKAVHNAVILEQLAKTALYTTMLNKKAAPPVELVRKHFERKRGKGAYYGQK